MYDCDIHVQCINNIHFYLTQPLWLLLQSLLHLAAILQVHVFRVCFKLSFDVDIIFYLFFSIATPSPVDQPSGVLGGAIAGAVIAVIVIILAVLVTAVAVIVFVIYRKGL